MWLRNINRLFRCLNRWQNWHPFYAKSVWREGRSTLISQRQRWFWMNRETLWIFVRMTAMLQQNWLKILCSQQMRQLQLIITGGNCRLYIVPMKIRIRKKSASFLHLSIILAIRFTLEPMKCIQRSYRNFYRRSREHRRRLWSAVLRYVPWNRRDIQ